MDIKLKEKVNAIEAMQELNNHVTSTFEHLDGLPIVEKKATSFHITLRKHINAEVDKLESMLSFLGYACNLRNNYDGYKVFQWDLEDCKIFTHRDPDGLGFTAWIGY